MKLRSGLAPLRSGAVVAYVLAVPVYFSAVVGATAADWAHEDPAAAEDIQLHSTCAAWGQQILEGNFIRYALHQEQFSRYSPTTNRCYVEMRVETVDRNNQPERFGQYLYDGQTKEMLAFAQIQNGKKSGRVFDPYHSTTSYENAGWDDASEYIDTMMSDEWR